MKIKRIVLSGFKSFLDKTTFSFEVPVTSIVGPNGCGKSNIVDALKWVTGELSFKELRGRNMEDLIFSGSELRPPTSMMEVSMDLENADGRAPAQFKDFEVINILRRMFRDGSSEFYINKTACRLRDITDLFLDTGIGESSYSIIEQGKVGAIVSSRPEDRRLMIEEAAGITKFKSRKKAALRKMESTEQNLLRVGDLLKEISRQISTLERQAKKAQKFKEIKDHAQTLDLSLMHHDYSLNCDRINRLNDEIVQFEGKGQDAHNVIVSREADLETIKTKQIEIEKKFELSQAAVFELKEKISLAQSQIESLEQQIDRLNILSKDETIQANQLRDQASLMKQKVTSIDESLDSLKEQKTSIDDACLQQEAKYNAVFDEFSQHEKKLDEEQKRLVSVVSQLSDLTGRKESATNNLKNVEQRRNQLEEKINQVQFEIQTLIEHHKEKEAELEQVKQLKFGFEKDQRENQEKLQELKYLREKYELDLSKNMQVLEGLKSKHQTLLQFTSTYQGYHEGVRNIMSDKTMNLNIEGLLGEMITVKKGFEKAAQAALEDWIECMVVDEPNQAIKAIDFLSHGKGKGAFLSKRMMKSPNARQVNVPEGKTRLTAVVEFKTNSNEFFKELLSDVVIVEELHEAIELWNQGYRLTFVTIKGERLSRLGVISGGRWEGEQGVLEIKTQISELEEKISSLKQVVSNLEATVLVTRQDMVNSENLIKGLQESLKMQQTKTSEREAQYHRLEESLRHVKEKLNGLVSESKQVQEQIVSITSDVQEKISKIEEAGVMKSTLDEQVSLLSKKKSDVKALLEAKNNELTEIKMKKVSMAERFESYTREKNQLVSQIQMMLNNASQLDEKSKNHISESETLKSKVGLGQNLKKELTESYLEKEKINQDVRSQFDQCMIVIKEKEDELKNFRTNQNNLVEALNIVKLKFQEEEHQKSRLIEQTQERYQMDLTQVDSSSGVVAISAENEYDLRTQVNELKEQMRKMGDVHVGAIEELTELTQRHEFLQTQHQDLQKSLSDLNQAIKTIDATTKEKFEETFKEVNQRFQALFPKLFQGGKATLSLSDPENLLDTGVEIMAQPPGKRLQNMNLLSGGEKALTAISLLFAIFQYKAPPFCVLDEVDAPLDDMNVIRFSNLVKEMSNQTQFIIVTHNKITMEIADNLYGITMEEPGISRVVSVRVQKAVEEASQSEENLSYLPKMA